MAVPEFWNVRNFNFALLRRTGNKYCFVAIYQFPLCVTFVYTFYRFYLSTFLHLLYGLFQFSYIFICLKCVCSRTWNKSHVITNILLYGTVMFYCIEICLFIYRLQLGNSMIPWVLGLRSAWPRASEWQGGVA